MNAGAVREAVALAGRGASILVATASGAGVPHLAAAGGLQAAANGSLEVTAWFCPGTLENLERNPVVSVTVWDPEADLGHQIIGEVERVESRAMLDGFAYGLERDGALPQVERAIVVRPQRALIFSHAPHTDREE